jgi:hypothetical protein
MRFSVRSLYEGRRPSLGVVSGENATVRCSYCDEPITGKPVIRDGMLFCSLLCADRAIDEGPDDYDQFMSGLVEDSGRELDDDDDDI